MDQQILAKISEQFKQLHSPLYLLDEHGNRIVEEEEEEILHLLLQESLLHNLRKMVNLEKKKKLE